MGAKTRKLANLVDQLVEWQSVVVADGSPEMKERLNRVLTNDPGTGVMRHADAGYEKAVKIAEERDLKLPMVNMF